LVSTYVAYSGEGTFAIDNDYIRIDGPRVWIEFAVRKAPLTVVSTVICDGSIRTIYLLGDNGRRERIRTVELFAFSL